MLDINMEYRKGILFVRLGGDFSKDSCRFLDDELKILVGNNNIKFVTFNLSNLQNIDIEGIDAIINYDKVLSGINGKAMICGVNNEFIKLQVQKSNILDHVLQISDELSAVRYLNIGGYL